MPNQGSLPNVLQWLDQYKKAYTLAKETNDSS